MAKSETENAAVAIEDQIAELRSRIDELSRSLQDSARDAAEDAGEFMDGARTRARQVVRQVRNRGHEVVDAVRENPGTTTSALLAVGAIGLTIGYLLSSRPSRNDFWSR